MTRRKQRERVVAEIGLAHLTQVASELGRRPVPVARAGANRGRLAV